eukprot:c27876_g2_i2 orf=442-3111(-)
MPKNLGKSEEPLNNGIHSSEDRVHSCRLRGLRWRIMLDVLPPYPATVEELRRAAADGRRRYAELRRRLLVDPHTMEELRKPSQLSMDNPLSQDPESIWGQYFRNAELERTIDKDLARLYPEHGNYFQSPVCQAMLRRILLVWSLIHPHYSYQQGMHELLAPLIYALHIDILHFSELKQRYGDLFNDRFDWPSLQELSGNGSEGMQNGMTSSMYKAPCITGGCKISDNDGWVERIARQDFVLLEPDEFGFDLKTIVWGSDAYGVEGDLGALLSERFVEHDAYCMFDALLGGQGGAVVMAEYFMTANGTGSATGLSPVLEASAALYRALSVADFSLYCHLVGLGVEPQFFALRWLRVLFGREFSLDNLLLLWDAIFAASNTAVPSEENACNISNNKCSSRSAFISALAVSMLLYLRPSLLAAPDATSCLQKLLNFPQHVDARSLIDNTKVLQPLAREAANIMPHNFEQCRSRKMFLNESPPHQGHIKLQHQKSCSPELLRSLLPESYWEEKWKDSVLQNTVSPDTVGLQNRQITGMVGEFVDKMSVSNTLCQHTGRSSIAIGSKGNIDNQKQTLSAKQDMNTAVVDQVHHDCVNQSVRRKLISGPAECINNPISTCRSLDLPESRGSDSSDLGHIQSEKDATSIEVHEVHENVPHLDKGYSAETDGSALRGAWKGGAVAFESTPICPLLHEGKQINFSVQSSTPSAVSEDHRGTLGNSSSGCKAKALDVDLQSRRFFWLRNLCRRAKSTVQSTNDDISTNRTATLPNGTGGFSLSTNFPLDDPPKTKHECQSSNGMPSPITIPVASNDIMDGDEEIPEEKWSPAALQALGHSMLDNIQVLEAAFCQRVSITAVSSEKPEQASKACLNGRGETAAFEALAELRKISGLLLQM